MSDEAQRFAEAVTRRVMARAERLLDGSVRLSFTEDDVNAALIEIGVSPINGRPLAENETVANGLGSCPSSRRSVEGE